MKFGEMAGFAPRIQVIVKCKNKVGVRRAVGSVQGGVRVDVNQEFKLL